MEKILKSVLSVLMVGMGLLAFGADDAIPLKNMWDTNRLYTAEMVDSKISQAVEGGDYNNLTNKPSIGGVVLEGNKTASALGLQPTIADYTTTGAVQNIVEGYGYATETAVAGALNGKQDKLPYPTNAIPQGAVSGLSTALAGKLDKTGGTITGKVEVVGRFVVTTPEMSDEITIRDFGGQPGIDVSSWGSYLFPGKAGAGIETFAMLSDIPNISGKADKADVAAAALAATNYTDEAIGDISFPVRSVNQKTGAVTLAASDVGALSSYCITNGSGVYRVVKSLYTTNDAASYPVIVSELDEGTVYRTMQNPHGIEHHMLMDGIVVSKSKISLHPLNNGFAVITEDGNGNPRAYVSIPYDAQGYFAIESWASLSRTLENTASDSTSKAACADALEKISESKPHFAIIDGEVHIISITETED